MPGKITGYIDKNTDVETGWDKNDPTYVTTETPKKNAYNAVANVINNIIPGELLDLPIQMDKDTKRYQYNIRDADGNIIETVQSLPGGYKPGRKIYKTEDGSWTYKPTTKVTLNQDTGEITVTAPDFVMERDNFQKNFSSQLETLSRYYQQAPDALIPQADGSTKSIPQIIEELNDPDNPSSLAAYTDAVLSMQDQEYGYANSDGEYEGDRKAYNIPDEIKLNDDYFMLRNTIALGDDVKDTTLQAIPLDLKQADFLRELESFDKDTGTVQFGDLMKHGWNRHVEGVKDEDDRMKTLKAGLEEYFAQGDYSDTDEFARCVSLYEFITHKAPDAEWYQHVAYATSSFFEGAWNEFVQLGGILGYGHIAIPALNEWLVNSFSNLANNGKFEGSSSIWNGWSEVMDYWNDIEDERFQDRLYLDPSAAAAFQIGNGIASLVTLIAAGNAAESIAKSALAGVAAKTGAYATTKATEMYLASGAAVPGMTATAISEGMQLALNTVNATTAAKMANVISAIAGAKTTSVTVGLVAETFAESITGNPEKFYRVLNSGELTDEAKAQLWEDFIGNSVGLAVGVSAGKGLMKLGETTKGRAISMNLARRLAKMTTAIGDEWAQVVAKAHGMEDITDYIKKLNEGGKTEKAQALLARELIRDVKKGIADQDYIKVFGRSEEEVLESISEVEDSLHKYRAFENAIDEYNRKGLGIASEWYSDLNIKFNSANDAMEDTYESLRKMEGSSNISGLTRTGKLAISKNTSDYIQALLKRDIAQNVINVMKSRGELPGAIKDVQDELDNATEIINRYEKLVGGNQNLIQTSKKYAQSLKNFYAEANNMLVREGLINSFELESLRESGLWGENGELYVHFQRDIKKNGISPLTFQGNFRTDTVEYFKSYTFGSDAEYLDPLVTSRLYMRRFADKAARQEVVRQYINATGTGQELITAAQTEAARIMKEIRPEVKDEISRAVKSAAGEVRALDTVRLFANMNTGESLARFTNKSIANSSERLQELTKAPLKEFLPTRRAATETMMSIDKEDVLHHWAIGMEKVYGPEIGSEVTVYKYLSDHWDELPNATRSYINECVGIDNYAKGLNKTDYFMTEAGQKEATRMALARNGLLTNNELSNKGLIANPYNALSVTHFQGKGMREIRSELSDIFGKDVGDAIIERASKGLKKNKEFKTNLIQRLRKSASEVFLNREGTAFTAKGERLYKKMMDHQTTTAISEWLQSQKNFDSARYNALKKGFPEFDEQVMRRTMGASDFRAGADPFQINEITRQTIKDDQINKTLMTLITKENDLAKINEVYSEFSKENLAYGMNLAVDKFVEEISSRPNIQKAYQTLIDYYGIDAEDANQYLALRTLFENKTDGEGIRKKLTTEIEKELRREKLVNDKGKIGKRTVNIKNSKEYLAGRFSDIFWDTAKSRYDDLRTKMHEIAPAFVDEDKMFDEVEKLTADINKYRKDVDNVVAIQDEMGRVSFMKTDPLLATMMNHEPVSKGFTRMEKANYLLSKTFRLGTTSLNLKSLVNQTFRDFGNAFVGGNLYRTWSRAKTDMAEVLGENVVDWIRRSDADLADYIIETAKKTGRAEQEVAYDAIRSIGKSLAPTATETEVYRRASDVSKSIKAGKAKGLEKITGGDIDGVTGKLDKVGDKLGVLNEAREKGLRYAVFQNGFADAVKRGYSFDQAKAYATFLMDNATTNFGRTSTMFSRLQRTVPFLGAAINGTTSFYRLLSVDPVGVVGRLIGGIVLPTAYLTSNSLLTEKDRATWRSIKEYEKDDNIIFIADGQVYSIPIPQEMSAWINPIRHLIEKDAGANMHSVMQLAVNDIVGLSPIDLDGFVNIDANMLMDGTDGEGFFVNNIEPGLAKLFAQLAPVPMKSAMMYVTGIDPYTMKKIDKTYMGIDLDTGESIVMNDYSSSAAKKIADLFSGIDGFEMSAPMAEKMLGSLFGSAPVEYAGWLVDLGDAVFSNKSVVDALSSSAESMVDMITSPVTVPQYSSKAQADWKEAVKQMYDEKEALLMSDEWRAYETKRRNATTAEELTKLANVRANLVRGYYDKLQAMTNNLKDKYQADFTKEKYAAVISLSVLEQSGADTTVYGQMVSNDIYQDAKTRAIDTMYRMGFQAPTDYSMFGYLKANEAGETYVAYTTPMAILQLRNNMNYAKNLHIANMQTILEGAGLQKNSDAYRAMQNRVDQIYAKGTLSSADYDAVSAIYKDWDAQVMARLYPYLRQYGVENVLENSDVVEALNDVIKVPSDFAKTKQGRYFSSPGLNKQAGYAKAYIEYVYNKLEEQ